MSNQKNDGWNGEPVPIDNSIEPIVIDGELLEPFFKAFFSDDAWLMYEVQDRCTDEQWPLLLDSFARSDRKLTEKKNKVKKLVWQAQSVMIDLGDAYKQNVLDGHEDGMIDALLDDIPSEYFKQQLIESVK